MRAHEILGLLTKKQIADVAGKLGLTVSGRNKASLQKGVSQSLLRTAGDHAGAVELLSDLLTVPLLRRALANTCWDGRDAEYEVVRTSYLREAEAKELLVRLALAEQDGDVAEIDKIAGSRKFGDYLVDTSDVEDDVPEEEVFESDDEPEDEAFDSDDEPEDEAFDSDDEDVPDYVRFERGFEESAPWENENVLWAGPGVAVQGIDTGMRPLFEHQTRSLSQLQRWWVNHGDRGILSLPTGSGKTRTAVSFALRTVLASGGQVLWLAHRHELVNQAVSAFARYGAEAQRPFKVGRFEAHPRKAKEPVDVLVASVATLAHGGFRQVGTARKLVPNLRLIVVDECHHAVATTWRGVITALQKRTPGVRLLGLTATPTRTAESERPALARMFGEIIHAEAPLHLIRDGILALPKFTFPGTGRSFTATDADRRLFAQFKDLPPDLVKRMGEDRERNQQIASHLLAPGKNWGQSLVFAATVVQAEQLATLIGRHRKAALLTGKSSQEERRQVLRAFEQGHIKVLVNVDLFTEGTDLPRVDSVFIARPSKSVILLQQMVGRGLRGPKVGGTSECNVVGFRDDIVGLAYDQFHRPASMSSFASEADLSAAFDLEKVAAMPAATRPARPVLALQILPLTHTSAGAPLVGWWEVARAGEKVCLAVLEPDAQAVKQRMSSIPRQTLSAPEGLKFISNETWAQFAEAVEQSNDVPRFVPVEKLASDDRAILSEALASIPVIDEVPAPVVAPQPTQLGLPSVAATTPLPPAPVTTPSPAPPVVATQVREEAMTPPRLAQQSNDLPRFVPLEKPAADERAILNEMRAAVPVIADMATPQPTQIGPPTVAATKSRSPAHETVPSSTPPVAEAQAVSAEPRRGQAAPEPVAAFGEAAPPSPESAAARESVSASSPETEGPRPGASTQAAGRAVEQQDRGGRRGRSGFDPLVLTVGAVLTLAVAVSRGLGPSLVVLASAAVAVLALPRIAPRLKRSYQRWAGVGLISIVALGLIGSNDAGDQVANTPAAPMAGQWRLTTTTETTVYKPFEGLQLEYDVRFTRHGSKFTAEGEKVAENGKPLPKDARTPIQLEGTFDGRTFQAVVTEIGARRTTRGAMHWTGDARGQGAGRFETDAATSSGQLRVKAE